MKIVIVSTAYPLRGGIAQYTGILYRKLRERNHTVHVLTFKRQYPKILFPGKTQLENSQDPSVRIDSEPILDSIGPLSWWKAFRRIRALRPDMVFFKYWMPFFAPCYGTIARLTRRFTHARIVYLCDNILPHERRPGDVLLTRLALGPADAYIVQSGAVRDELLSLFPGARYALVPHPVYEIFGQPMDKGEAREQLKLKDERVLLFFGYVRAYKGLETLLKAMAIILKKLKTRLLIVGEFYEDEEKYRKLVADLQIQNRVSFYAEFIPNEEVGVFFSAADVVVLPYKSATQSGIVQLAYQLDKPCIVTDVGGLAEVVLNGRTGYVTEPESPAAIADAVVRFYEEAREEEFSRNVGLEKKKYSWENLVQTIEGLES